MAKKPTGLGKGFEALIPKDFDAALLTDQQERVQKLLITDVKPAPQQPRTQFNDASLQELADSISQHGVLQPIIVRSNGPGDFTIIAGERRWRAAQKAGLTQIPAIVRSLQDLEQLEIALVENVQREDLSPLDQAIAIKRLLDQFNLSAQAVAQRLGKATSTVSNLVRLVDLPADAQAALRAGQISEGHARAILSFKDQPAQQTKLLQLIRKNHWSVRQAEQYVVAARKGGLAANQAQKRTVSTTPATQKLSRQLGTAVTLKRTAKGGKLEIAFKNEVELESLINRLGRG